MPQRGLELAPLRRQVDRGQQRRRPTVDRRLALEHLALQRRRKSLRRMAELATEQRHHRLREPEVTAGVEHVPAVEAVGDHVEGHVGDGGGGRRDLHDVAEQHVHLGIPPADLVPAVLEPEPAGLLAKVRVLRPRHLVAVDVRGPSAHVGLERHVVAAHDFPVPRQRLENVEAQARILRGAGQRGHQGAQVRLRGQPAHRVDGAVDRVGAGVDGGQHAGRGDAAGVVGVEVDRQPHLVTQRGDQRAGGQRPAHPGHVLDAQDLGAGLLELPREVDVVPQMPLRPRRIEQIARVAHRGFAERPGLAHGVDGHAHVLHAVHRVEDPEQVDAGLRGLGDEVLHDVVGVAAVADRVGGPHHRL